MTSPRLASPRLAAALALTLSACASVGEPASEAEPAEVVDALAEDDDGEEHTGEEAVDNPPAEIIYELIRTLDAVDGEVERSESGELDHHQWRKSARPDPRVDGEYLYQDVAQTEELDDGTVRSTVTYTRRPNPEQALAADDDRPSSLALEEDLVPGADGLVHVAIKIAGFPEWDIPLVVPPDVFSEQEEAQAAQEREDGLNARASRFDELRGPIDALVRELGGEPAESSWTTGWIDARVPVSAVSDLIASPLVRNVSPGDRPAHEAWILGEAGEPARYNTDVFRQSGYNGGGTTIGVIEIQYLNDEVCFKYDGSACSGTSRLKHVYDCANPYSSGSSCDEVTNLPDDPTVADHATLVTSVAAADYTDHQARDHTVGDDSWTAWQTGDHDGAWEIRATALAPEVDFVFAGWVTTEQRKADAVDAVSQHGDAKIINMSFGTGPLCGTSAQDRPFNEAIENAFDDGRVVIVAGGNDENHDEEPFGPCDTLDQAGLPKALGISSISVGSTTDYSDALISVAASANGGADAITPDNVSHAGAMSLIALAAVDRNQYATDAGDCSVNFVGSLGSVREDPTQFACGTDISGSSIAAPVVTSAAALLHEWGKWTWGPSAMAGPGRLNVVLLGMGDAHYSPSSSPNTTVQRTTRADRRFGMGRLKVKQPTRTLLTTTTLTSVANQYSSFIGTSALPANYTIVKCVALQHEDMSSKTKISDVTLRVELWNPSVGFCTTSNPPYTYVDDTGFDVKSMVARRGNIGGKCARVTLNANQVQGYGVSVSLFCYASAENDDEPN